MAFNQFLNIATSTTPLFPDWSITIIIKDKKKGDLTIKQYNTDAEDELSDKDKVILGEIYGQAESKSIGVEVLSHQKGLDHYIGDDDQQTVDIGEDLDQLDAEVEKVSAEMSSDFDELETLAIIKNTASPADSLLVLASDDTSERKISQIPTTWSSHANPETPITSIIPQTPAMWRKVQVMGFINDEDSGKDGETDEEDESDDSPKNPGLRNIQQPDWNQEGSDDENNNSGNPRKLPLKLPLADFSSGRDIKTKFETKSNIYFADMEPTTSEPKAVTPVVHLRPRRTIRAVEKLDSEKIEFENLEPVLPIGAVTSTSTPDPAENQLVTTKTLFHYGVVFNLTHKLLICQSCGEGFAPSSLFKHLRTEGATRTNWDSASNSWKSGRVVFDHKVGPIAFPQEAQFIKEITTSLIKDGHIKKAENIRNSDGAVEWLETAVPAALDNNPLPVVLGLRIFKMAKQCTVCLVCNGLKTCSMCKPCLYICPAKKTLGNHLALVHGGSNAITKKYVGHVTAQTFSELSGWQRYFPVSLSSQKAGQLPQSLVSGKPDIAAAINALTRKKCEVMAQLDILPDEDIRTILPFFSSQTKIDEFLLSFDRKVLYQTYQPDRHDANYSQLRTILVKSYQDDLALLPSIHESIKMRMTNCTPDVQSRFIRRAFASLTEKKSIAAYATMELKLIWSLLKAYDLKTKDSFFTFDNIQQMSLKSLWQSLKKETPEKITNKLYQLLDSIYFPKQHQTINSIFKSPPIAFMALLCIQENGSYSNIHLIPPRFVMLQYSFRLRAAHKFHEWKPELKTDSSAQEYFEKCVNFCQQYLQDYNMAPFSSVRTLLHFGSVASRSTPRPDDVWWAGNTVTVGEKVINFDDFKVFLQKKLDEIEVLVEKDVLLGTYSLADVEKLFKVSRLKELKNQENNLSNGVLFDARNQELENDESKCFLTQLIEKGQLGLEATKGGNIHFNDKKSVQWVLNIDKAMRAIQCLCHITQGPPGRMTEQALQSPIDTINGSRHVVFEESEGTGGFRAQYHKSAHITGDHKDIFRLLPYRVFRLLYVMIRLVRPIEINVLLLFLVPLAKQQEMVTAYKERIWASYGRAWDATKMSENLQQFMMDGMGVPMGARPYRHFAIALQRHFPKTNYWQFQTNPENQHLALAADFMAGHSQKVAEMNYAREPSVITSPTARAAFIRVSKDWHALLGLSTSIVSLS